MSENMPLFTAKARPRLTRSSTSSMKKKERQIYMYLYIYLLALAFLLVVSITIVHFGLGRSSAHTAHDAKHMSEGASGAEDLRVGRQKDESGAAVRYEIKDANRKELAERFSLSMDRKTRSAVKSGVGNRWIEEGEGGSKEKEVQYVSDIEGRERTLNDEDLEEFQSGSAEQEFDEAQKSQDEMDQLSDADAVTEDAYRNEGQVLEDMDKFDNHQVAEAPIKPQSKDDAVPTSTQELSELRGIERNRKYAQNRAEKQAKGSSLVSEDDTPGTHLQDGKKESRKLGFREDSGRDVFNKEREGEELERFDNVDGSVAGQLGSESSSLFAKRNNEAAKGSIRAAIEEEREKRNGVFWRQNSMGVGQGSEEQAGDTNRLNLWETNPDPSFWHVKASQAEKTNPVKSGETGMPPLRGFKEFSENMKVSHNNESLDTNVLQMDVKSRDTVIFDEGTSQARIVDSFNLPNVKENKGDMMQSSRSAQETAEVHNPDSMNALAMEERTSMNKQFDHEGHLESADVMQSDKQLIKEDRLTDNVEDIRDEVEEEMKKSRKNNEDDPAVEENRAVEGELESKKTNEGDSVVVEEGEDDNMIQWGYYPTISSKLQFSKFLYTFFTQESCSLRIFMAWTTAPWAYTPRHQRSVESILHFHPQACIVVFTETIEFKFFESWVKEGYKIVVARPNLEELLGQTPAIDFAYIWYEWRRLDLFYIHYTELLRIAALHKYGGVWLDMDMILTRPLPKLHNVLGSTVSESGEWVLNGAFMSFNKSSLFLKACIEEFVATYDETSLGWNGADLLNRVASNATKKGGKEWLEESQHLQVLEPIAFFPLSRHNIIRYFSAPNRNHERVEQKKMLSAILDESYGIHLWNSVTGRHVPEVGSLVEKLLNQNCMRCTDLL